jgi:long-chain acyl-CoA synthetase
LSELEFILNDAQVKNHFLSTTQDLFHKVLSIRDGCPALREIYTFEHVAGARHWKELLATPTPKEEKRLAVIRESNRGNGPGNDHLYFRDDGHAKGGDAFAL